MSTRNQPTEKAKKYFWQKKQKELTADDITIVDKEMLKCAVGAAALMLWSGSILTSIATWP